MGGLGNGTVTEQRNFRLAEHDSSGTPLGEATNAGITENAPVDKMTLEGWNRAFQVNVTSALQIANKSMLLDTKIGQRLLDDCVHPEQTKLMEAAKAARIADPEAEAAAQARNGLGITPTGSK